MHQLLELLGPQRLRPVGEGAVGVGMDFDHQAVGARGYGGPRHGSHDVAAPGGVRRIGENRQVGQFLHRRDGGEIERVARVGFEGAYAALAENNVVVAAGQDVLGGEIERVARVGFEGAYAALAENNVVVAAGQDVLGGEIERVARVGFEGAYAALD